MIFIPLGKSSCITSVHMLVLFLFPSYHRAFMRCIKWMYMWRTRLWKEHFLHFPPIIPHPKYVMVFNLKLHFLALISKLQVLSLKIIVTNATRIKNGIIRSTINQLLEKNIWWENFIFLLSVSWFCFLFLCSIVSFWNIVFQLMIIHIGFFFSFIVFYDDRNCNNNSIDDKELFDIYHM